MKRLIGKLIEFYLTLKLLIGMIVEDYRKAVEINKETRRNP